MGGTQIFSIFNTAAVMECKNKKAFNLKAKHLLPDRCMGYRNIYVNIYWGGVQMNNFEQVYVVGDPHVVVGGWWHHVSCDRPIASWVVVP